MKISSLPLYFPLYVGSFAFAAGFVILEIVWLWQCSGPLRILVSLMTLPSALAYYN